MSVTVYFGNISKRRNSTLQPAVTVGFDVLLKSSTSLDNPTFLLTATTFTYNYAKWDDRYYFVNNIVSVRNGQWEVSCELDPLATYKTDILSSTQFVSYSSQSGGTWLADTRIPVLKNPTVSRSSAAISIFAVTGYYILSTVSISGCKMFAVTQNTLQNIVNSITTWQSDYETAAMDSLVFNDPDIESIARALTRSGAIGNTWENTTQCIRECHWTPFVVSGGTGGVNIWLGDFDTGESGILLNSLEPITGSIYITIPWQFNDWRRVACEDIYLYIPLVGSISIPTENIAHVSTLEIKYSYTLSDGVVTFEVIAGTEIIGTYGANCSAQVPVGILQSVGVGQILNSIAKGAEKMAAASLGGAAIAAAGLIYDVNSQVMSKNLTTIGGIGGGAGAGLDKSVYCTSVAHDTVVTPSSMAATLGVPTMKPLTLSGLTGFCQCANAHVAAPAEAQILDVIDAYLNAGFYIE